VEALERTYTTRKFGYVMRFFPVPVAGVAGRWWRVSVGELGEEGAWRGLRQGATDAAG